MLRLLHSGKTMRVYPLPFYFYRKHGSSISHRLNESVLVALKAANRRFLAQVSKSDRHLVAAINASIRSIETALAYEWLLNALKGRDWLGSLRIALTNPRAGGCAFTTSSQCPPASARVVAKGWQICRSSVSRGALQTRASPWTRN